MTESEITDIDPPNPGSNFSFHNPARNCTIIIAYCVNNLQCIGYFLLYEKIDELINF